MKDRLSLPSMEPVSTAAEYSGVFLRREDGTFLHCDRYCARFFGIEEAPSDSQSLANVIQPNLIPYFEALDEVCLDQQAGVLELGPSEGLSGLFRVSQERLPGANGDGMLLGRVSALDGPSSEAATGQWSWDIVEDTTEWSEGAERILDLPPSESPGFRQYLDRVHLDDRREVLSAVSSCLYRGKPFELEHRIVLPSGLVRTLYASGRMEHSPTARPRRMLGVIRTRETSLGTCSELSACAGLIDHLPEAVFWVDPEDCTILDVNKLACLFLETSRHQLLTSNFSTVLDSDKWNFGEETKVCQSNPAPRLFECGLKRPNGKIMPVEVNAKLIQQDGEARVLAVVRNISVRRGLQDSLLASESFTSDLLLDIPQMVARWSRDGELVFANEAFCQTFGAPLEVLLGRTIQEFVWESELPTLENALQRLEGTGDAREIELRDSGDPVSNRWFRWRIRSLGSTQGGEPNGYQTVATEVTSQMRRATPSSVGNERLRIAFQAENDQPALVCQKPFQSLSSLSESFEPEENKKAPKSLSDLDRLLHDEDREALNLRLAERYQASSLLAVSVTATPETNDLVVSSAGGLHSMLFTHSPEAMVVHTLEGNILEVNVRASELLGSSEEQLKTASLLDYPDRRELLCFRLALDELRADGKVAFDTRLRVMGGGLIPVEISSSVVKLDDSTLAYSIIRDISDRKAREERTELSAKVFENTSEAVLITDSKGNIVTVNKAFSKIYQYAAHEVLGCNPSILRSGRQNEAFYRDMWRELRKNGHWQGELWNRRKSGDEVPVWESISAVKDSDGNLTHYIAVVADISSLKQAEDDHNYLAYHDPLTDLPNRLLFNEQVSQALKHSKRAHSRLSVMFMDLDRFKNINDTFGHPVGDEVLRLVSHRIRGVLRDEDVIARIGGDEFIMMLENIHDAGDASLIARKILDCFSKPFSVSGKDLYLSSSIGISVYPEDGADVSTLVKNADTAMYQAKNRGRNDFRFYTEELAIDPSEHLFLETGLRQALGRGELDVYYQPQIALDTGQIVGAEALVRWRHPEKGLMTPEYFIPLAEETGLIVPIGFWVLSEACAQAKKWHEEGYPLRRISVNLSTIQVQRGDIVSSVAQVLRRTGLAPEFLELEITENFILEDSDQSVKVLQGLRDLGVMLAIDDFGTGYSNLSYLKRLPVSKLKIDKSFVRDMHNDPNDEDIVRAVIALGKSLHLRLVAEGIEQEQQLQFLMAEGCHEGQGYLYSGPVPAEEFPELYRRFCGAELNLYPLDSHMH